MLLMDNRHTTLGADANESSFANVQKFRRLQIGYAVAVAGDLTEGNHAVCNQGATGWDYGYVSKQDISLTIQFVHGSPLGGNSGALINRNCQVKRPRGLTTFKHYAVCVPNSQELFAQKEKIADWRAFHATLRAVDWKEIDSLRDRLASPLLRIGQHHEDEIKLVEYDFNSTKRFPRSLKTVELIHLTDPQVGAKTFQRKRFVEYRDWIMSSPNRFVFLGGDLIDAATVLSVASPYDNTKEPIDQVDEVVDLLKPLAKDGRLLGYVGGNHERRTIKTFGDVGRLIGKELQVPYSRGVQLIDIYYGQHKPFKVSLWHGSGGARTKGAKAQMVSRFMSQADSQLYMVGHLHDALVLFDWRQQRIGKKIKLQKIAGVMSSSFLGYWGSYAETFAMSPSDTLMGRVVLDAGGGWEITLKTLGPLIASLGGICWGLLHMLGSCTT